MKKFIAILMAFFIGTSAFAYTVGIALPGTNYFKWYNNVDIDISSNSSLRVITISQNNKTVAAYYGDMWQIIVQ